jgi:tRNA1(Val) A37 N6-methylase TrmN6
MSTPYLGKNNGCKVDIYQIEQAEVRNSKLEDNYDTEKVTRDAFLGGLLHLLQPQKGYRAAIDSVLLAASVRAAPEERILDVGSGVGTVCFCVSARVPSIKAHGIEINPFYAALSQRNARDNGVSGWVCHTGDVYAPEQDVRRMVFDHVITNPPFYSGRCPSPSPVLGRDVARREKPGGLSKWLQFCQARLAPGGELTLVHLPDRLPEILSALTPEMKGIEVLPLQPRRLEKPSRIIVRARKGRGKPFSLAVPRILHNELGSDFTQEMQGILRGGRPLLWSP